MPTAFRNVRQTVKPSKSKMSIVIPNAGMGNRMKSYGPKCLLSIHENGMTILDNQLKHIFHNIPHIAEVIIVGGFENYKIAKHIDKNDYNVKLVLNELYETTNVVHSIGVGLSNITTDRVLILNGDLVFNSYALKAPFGEESMVLIDKEDGYMKDIEVGCIIANHRLERIMYDLPNKWAQITYFCGRELDLLKMICNNRKYDVCFGFEAINLIINSSGLFTTYTPKRIKITDMDISKDLQQAGNII